MKSLVIDTDVFVAALLGPKGAAREVVRRCLQGCYQPLMGVALFSEYREVTGRGALFTECKLSEAERDEVFQAFLHRCQWTEIYYRWRPNLRDEGDNHLLELALAGGAEALVTRNIKDFRHSDLHFPTLRIVSPEACIKEFPCLP